MAPKLDKCSNIWVGNLIPHGIATWLLSMVSACILTGAKRMLFYSAVIYPSLSGQPIYVVSCSHFLTSPLTARCLGKFRNTRYMHDRSICVLVSIVEQLEHSRQLERLGLYYESSKESYGRNLQPENYSELYFLNKNNGRRQPNKPTQYSSGSLWQGSFVNRSIV